MGPPEKFFNKQLALFTLIIIPFALLMVGVIGLWTIDVGASSFSSGSGYVTNGWWTRTGVEQYHIGLWLTLGTIVALALTNIALIIKFKVVGNEK